MRHAPAGLLLLLSLGVAGAAHASVAALELEVGAGQSALAPVRPAFSARVGLDVLGHFTPSLRLVSFPTRLGWSALEEVPEWALLAELRAHTGGVLQLTAGLGWGLGEASWARGEGGTLESRLRRAEPYLMADVGLRVVVRSFWVGAGLHGSPGTSGALGMLTLGWAPLASR